MMKAMVIPFKLDSEGSRYLQSLCKKWPPMEPITLDLTFNNGEFNFKQEFCITKIETFRNVRGINEKLEVTFIPYR